MKNDSYQFWWNWIHSVKQMSLCISQLHSPIQQQSPNTNTYFFYTNLHELFCQFISWTNWVNPGKFMDNCWISCQVMDDMEKLYKDLIIINLYLHFFCVTKYHSTLWKHQRQISRKKLRKFFRKRKLSLTNVRNWQHIQKSSNVTLHKGVSLEIF